MTTQLKIIQSIYNFIIDIVACIMKICVILSLPFLFIYYMYKAMANIK